MDHERGRQENCSQALLRAANWLADVCQITDETDQFDDPKGYPHGDYRGSMRTEYDTRERRWSLNGPCFHTGQAMRSLLVAHRRVDDARFLDAARRGAEFLLRERIEEDGHPQRGLLKSLEQNDDEINVQVTVEALSGLLDLYERDGEDRYLGAVTASVDILIRDAYLPAERLMLDHYSLRQRRFICDAENQLPGRAMVDDAVLARLYSMTDNQRYRDVFLEMADRLIEVEDPPGTWAQFPPWPPERQRVHNRKSWWWANPLLTAYDLSGDQRFLDAAIRGGDWYLNAQNLDGGLYYTPTPDGRHNSFGLCTSVVACAVIFWADLWRRLGDARYLDPIRRGVGYLLMAQFDHDVPDPNLPGALFEAPHPPDGTLQPGFQVRDLAAIFAIRAFDAVMDIPELHQSSDDWRDTTMDW